MSTGAWSLLLHAERAGEGRRWLCALDTFTYSACLHTKSHPAKISVSKVLRVNKLRGREAEVRERGPKQP